nr:protein NRT1/ PTR FAMILY 8.1-like [Lolium perenne]
MGVEAAGMYCVHSDGTVDSKGNPAEKKNTGNWRACHYILGTANECCERLAYYGVSTNLVNFMENRMGMAKVAAANSITTWSGTCFITSLLGAFLAHAYLGRFWTIASFWSGAADDSDLGEGAGAILCHPTAGSSRACRRSARTSSTTATPGSGAARAPSSTGSTSPSTSTPSWRRRCWYTYRRTWDGGWGFGIPAIVIVAVGTFFLDVPLYRQPASRRCSSPRRASGASRLPVVSGDALYSPLDSTEGSRKLGHTEQFRFLDIGLVRFSQG